MSLIPSSIDGKIQFFQSKGTPWGANAVAIGTTATAVTALATKVTTAQTKLAAAVAARAAAKNATADLYNAIKDMVNSGSDIIKQIRAQAATVGSSVYILAQIPAPATPTPVGAPGTPTDFKATLNPDGSLSVQWKCPNPTGSVGTIYQLSRRSIASDGTAGPFAVIGGSGTRSFIDNTVPAGVAGLVYQITALRSTAVGTTAQFSVNFGTTSGEMMTSVAQGLPVKIAA
ncbi:MAG TPA: hypothetical protein VFE58_08105 [Tepidisphaeraceae bacterium]|jgi:hypothetical protein|nr:hypothetical protein [Tepidisphaeraceae bacterium]